MHVIATASDRDFLGGVIEGFYGRTWTQTQRFHLLDQLAALGLNTYFYAPKDDLKHRAIWREPYDASELAEFRGLIQACNTRDIEFIYGLSPGLDLRFTDPGERTRIQERFQQLQGEGVRSFALLFDDLPGQLTEAEVTAFPSLAAAQCDVVNATADWLHSQRADGRLLFCPTPYCDQMDRQQLGGAGYLDEVGRRLQDQIDVLWTGPEIVSAEIPADSIERIAQRLRRRPILWDNLFANDYDLHRLHCGPYAGRPRELREKLRGILINPNNEYWANHIPLRTFAAFLGGDGSWDPDAAYAEALGNWHTAFTSARTPLQRDDLRLLTDCFYLPNTAGRDGRRLQELVSFLQRETSAGWEKAYAEFSELSQRIQRAFESLTELYQRELFHAWSRYGWQLKEQMLLFDAHFVRVAHVRKARHTAAAVPLEVQTEAADNGPAPLPGSLLSHWEQRPMTAIIRPFRSGDEAGAYHVCLKTGNHGDDGEPLYRDDPDALGRLFVGPYLRYEPELALILEDELGVCGYALAALDSRSFYARYDQEWRLELCRQFPEPQGASSAWTPAQSIHNLYHHPEYFCPEPYDKHPSHLHIDLLPRCHRRGLGTAMMRQLLAKLRELGSPGVHLGLSGRNPRAHRFYQSLGFVDLIRQWEGDTEIIYMGLTLGTEKGQSPCTV